MSRLTIFWAAHLTATVIFLAGCWLNLSIWLQGRIEGRAKPSLWGAIGASWRFVRRVGLRRTLRALLLDGLLHRRLLRQDFWRWFAHACLLGSFLALTLLSTFTGIFEEGFVTLLNIRTPLIEAIVNKDTPLMALLNETLGLIMIAGLLLVIARRYIRRPAQLRTGPPDTLLVVLLGVTLLSGYPTEVLRLLMEQAGPGVGWYSYISYPLSLPFRSLNWPWERLHYWVFLFHSLFASAFFAYVPFSKFFHVLVSPVVATANSLAGEEQAA